MSFIRRKGGTKTIYLPVTTSTAFTKDTLVTFSGGYITAAAAGTASADIVGVIRKTIASTDSDYATARFVPVEVPTERFTVWEADVTSGLVAADVLKEVDLTDAGTVDRSASSVKAVRCVQRISATKGLFLVKFMGSY